MDKTEVKDTVGGIAYCIVHFFELLCRFPSYCRYAKRHKYKYLVGIMVTSIIAPVSLLASLVCLGFMKGFPNFIDFANIDHDGAVWYLLTTDWGIGDMLGFVFVGGPILIWGIVSLLGLFLGIDVNKAE